MKTDIAPPPGIRVSVVRLSCSACGAEANASCSCGKPYVPVQQRVAEYDKANPGKSTRQAAADLDVDHSQVVRARQQSRGAGAPPETVSGRDGKKYPARREAEPGGEIARLRRLYGPDLKAPDIQEDLRAIVVDAFEKMNVPTLQAIALDYDRIYTQKAGE